jgi:hypothetical protein
VKGKLSAAERLPSRLPDRPSASVLGAPSNNVITLIELMHRFKKGQFKFWQYDQGIAEEIRLITYNLLAY